MRETWSEVLSIEIAYGSSSALANRGRAKDRLRARLMRQLLGEAVGAPHSSTADALGDQSSSQGNPSGSRAARSRTTRGSCAEICSRKGKSSGLTEI
jgi:hypothetical protein